MKLLTAVLVLLVSSSHVLGQSSDSSSTATSIGSSTSQASSDTTNGGSTAPAGTGSTVSAGTGSTAAPGTGPTDTPGSTVTGGSNTGSTTEAPTTTPTPIQLSTFPVSNNVSPLDAKKILQQAVQLDQQINALNDYLVKAQADTDPNNSPLFAQLNAFSANLTAQNATLQGYITQLQTLQTSQSAINNRVTSATNTFVCFSQSSCVTDVPTTPEPTSPGPTPSVSPCTNQTLKTDSDFGVSKSYSQPSIQNAAECVVSVFSFDATNNVTVTINATITGNDGFVRLVETRTQQSVEITNGTLNNYSFNGFQEVDVHYYSGPRSTIQFDFTYVEVNNCLLNCTGDNGVCKVSQSGVQYCECKPCQFSGDRCEIPYPDPCSGKQKRACGATGDTPFGVCYLNPCYDTCWACECSPGGETDSPQKCTQPTPSPWIPPVAPTGSPVCPTTIAPTTTAALFTSTIAPSAGSSTVNPTSVTGGSTGSPASPQTTVTSDYSTVTGGSSTGSAGTTQETSTAASSPSITS
uniref:EGF-like domain-containing protein n=1 Tax=Caenorhabditis tropicalis TaxID=1561998 RepID=A0A1I7UNP4_9PELO